MMLSEQIHEGLSSRMLSKHHRVRTVQLKRWQAEATELESTNAALLEALELAKGSVEWMADATDADPEDHERLAIVNEAIRKAKGE